MTEWRELHKARFGVLTIKTAIVLLHRGSNLISFAHDPEHQRFKQTAASGETIYLNGSGALSERLIGSGGTTQWTDYLFAGGGMMGQRVEHSVSGTYTRYFHKDHLGSVSSITDETGTVV